MCIKATCTRSEDVARENYCNGHFGLFVGIMTSALFDTHNKEIGNGEVSILFGKTKCLSSMELTWNLNEWKFRSSLSKFHGSRSSRKVPGNFHGSRMPDFHLGMFLWMFLSFNRYKCS